MGILFDRSSNDLLTCIITRDSDGVWHANWIPDNEVQPIKNPNLSAVIKQADAVAETIYSAGNNNGVAELQYAIYPWDQSKEIKVILALEQIQSEFIAKDIQGSRIAIKGKTLNDIITKATPEIPDTSKAMLHWVKNIPVHSPKHKFTSYDLPLLTDIKLRGEGRVGNLIGYGLALLIFTFTAVVLLLNKQDGIKNVWTITVFLLVWYAISILRNLMARYSGYVFPWFSDNGSYDIYLSSQTRKKYGLRKAGVIPSIIFAAFVFKIFILVLTYLIPD